MASALHGAVVGVDAESLELGGYVGEGKVLGLEPCQDLIFVIFEAFAGTRHGWFFCGENMEVSSSSTRLGDVS